MPPPTVLILGAGPSGISCAHHLSRHGEAPEVWDRNRRVGGLARTEEFQGFRFDVGPHRFFTKNRAMDRLWKTMAGDDQVQVRRLTRILYDGKLFQYPLKPLDALGGLGLQTSIRALASYTKARLTPHQGPPAHFEDWVRRRFGSVLYEIFFKH